ncbi:hypothetical protein BH10ACI1_BH10ACI1_27630 [soil metagenome]
MQITFRQILWGFVFVLCAVFVVFAQTEIPKVDGDTLTIGDSPDQKVISFGKKVIIEKHAKEVFSYGGDIIIEGKVDGDVAVLGGSIIQKENAFIGGDVIVIGGTYRADSQNPLRNEGKETVMLAMFEQELRDFAANPAQILSPSYTWSFFAQRILSILFWFIISLALTTIAPGAISRAVARFQLSTLKIFAIGFFGFWITIFGVIAGLKILPDYLSAIVSLMAFVLLILGYVFGRSALQMTVGKIIMKKLVPEKRQSETTALLFGVIFWTILLSIPYIWTFALLTLFSSSLGLVLTARSANKWQKV